MSSNKKKSILIFTRQVGSAAALYPVLVRLVDIGWSFKIIAKEESSNFWESKGFPYESNFDSQDLGTAAYDFILTGTSLSVKEDSVIWKFGKNNRIPTLAFVESWMNYSQRFTLKAAFDTCPSYIGVVDELMQKRLIGEGASNKNIVILGHPRFDLLKISAVNTAAPLKKDSYQRNIVFFTNNFVTRENGVLKLDNTKTLKVVELFLHNFLDDGPLELERYNVTIKSHPTEDPLQYQKLINKYNLGHTVMVATKNPIELLVEADCVFGISTILLVDSSILSIPTYSIQVYGDDYEKDIIDRQGIVVLKDWNRVSEVVKTIKNLDLSNSKWPSDLNSVDHFVDFIEKVTE